jgi:3-hydroxyisobutyrate dehydrogenase-like beta-hydroxyacid dehydrogenase
MAACLLRAGHRVTVFDRSPDAVKRLAGQGAAAAGSPREIAETPGGGRNPLKASSPVLCGLGAGTRPNLARCPRSAGAWCRDRKRRRRPASGEGTSNKQGNKPPLPPGVAAVISMLPSTEHVRDAFEGPEGVLRASALQPPLLIDCSTISPL